VNRALVAAALLAAACGDYDTPSSPGTAPSPLPPSPAPPGQVRVLMVTATAGFRHDSIGDARAAIGALGSGIQVSATEDLAALSAASLADFEVVFFALTSGELPLTADQKAALLNFVANGGGFLGAHSATDTLYEWPDYGALVGAYFREHPWTQPGAVVVENASHPANAGLESRVILNEEFYTFRDNPRPRVEVLLRLDSASVGASGDVPLAWAKAHGRGRVYYNALGHFGETWRNPQVQRQWRNAILWAARR
jgi:uncharacterized protein